MRNSALIIDSDINDITLIKSTLEFHDFNVFYSTNIKDIKKIIEKNPINIVIVDLMAEGVGALSVAKNIACGNKIPVIATGIKNLLSDERKILFSNKIPFLQKPVYPNKLLEKIRELI